MAIKTYTAKKSIDIGFGGIGGGAPMPSFGGSGLGNTLMSISNKLRNAKDKTELNKTAAANVTQLTSKMSDEQYRLDLSRDMADIKQNVMEAGGDVYAGTLEFAKKYGLEFRSPEEAKEIFQLTLQQYGIKEKQYADDRTGFILSAAPGAKDALKDLIPEQKEYHEILRGYAEQYNIKLDNGFDKKFIKGHNDQYAELVGSQKYDYLIGLQEKMGQEIFEEFIYAVSSIDNSNVDLVDRAGIFLNRPQAKIFFDANASKEDISSHIDSNLIKSEAKSLTQALLPSLTSGSMMNASEFTMKMEQLIYRYATRNGFDITRAAQHARQLFDNDDRKFYNEELEFVGAVDNSYLNKTYNADNSRPDFTANVKAFIDHAGDDTLRKKVFNDYIYPQLIKDVPGIEEQVRAEFAGATEEVLEQKIEERTKTKLESAFISNMRFVNARDGRKGFAVQIKELYDYTNHYGKLGEQVIIPFEVIGNENLFLKAYRERPEYDDPGFIVDFAAPFRE